MRPAAILSPVSAATAGSRTPRPIPMSPPPLDVRTLCLIRETLARHDGLADFAFAMQGLGAGPDQSVRQPTSNAAGSTHTRSGEAIAAFALTEQKSGSDVANIAMTATRDGDSLHPRRRENLDFQRRHRRSLRRVRANRRRSRARRDFRFPGPGRSVGLFRCRTHRRDRAASAGAAEIRCVRASRRPR